MTARIRDVQLSDACEIARIYAPIVESTHISFEEAAPSPEQMRERILAYAARFPWLVAEQAHTKQLAGYAYACPHRSRPAYRWSVDCSVYVDAAARGRGIGTLLYQELFVRLRRQRFHSVYAGIALPNDASVALHRSLGFVPVGVYHHVGYKHGAWRDVWWWHLRLCDDDCAPDEPLPVAANPVRPS